MEKYKINEKFETEHKLCLNNRQFCVQGIINFYVFRKSQCTFTIEYSEIPRLNELNAF